MQPSRLELFKTDRSGQGDLMKDFATPLKVKGAKDGKDAKEANPTKAE